MKVKTYGVPGLSEWHGKVKAGSIEVEVHFTGGTASPSGAQPAYFMTKDPIFQFVIENSKEFKDGFIILVMQQEVPGQHPRMAVPKPKHTEATDSVPAGVSVEVSDANEEAEEADDNLTKVEVADKNEAIEYLKEHFDGSYTATQLRTKTAFEAACKAHGIEFVFTA